MKGQKLGKFRVTLKDGTPTFMYRYGLKGSQEELAKVREHMEEVGIDPESRIDDETGMLTYNFFQDAGKSCKIELSRAGRPYIEDETAEVVDKVSKIADATVRTEVAKLVAGDIYASITGRQVSAPAQPQSESQPQVAPEEANLNSDDE